ncbi:MAG: phosphopyruvate hydratase [Actinomycetota bacterium]|nr:phosphopyruvate hydratase [Actinomycetota bacterium]MDA2996960.1 phosphopyruvate hydratase [Actinomycetota bacterium]
MSIKNLIGYQVLDSRGRPTVAVTLTMSDGSVHTARVPSGASTGAHEAKELRDTDSKLAEKFYGGKSVYQAVENINTKIAPRLKGHRPIPLATDGILVELDHTPDHHILGANALLAVSLAVAKAAAHTAELSLARFFQPEGKLFIPMPMVNILSGGAHANRTMDIQDVLVLPNGATSFAEALSWIVAIRELAASKGAKSGAITHLIADEGGLGIAFPTIDHALEFVTDCINGVGLSPEKDVSLAIDVASTQFFDGTNYNLAALNKKFSSGEFIAFISKLVSEHPVLSIEDPFAEDDWQSWTQFMSMAPSKLQVLGDDLFTTNLARLQRGIDERSANAILIKANQNGLVTSTQKVLSTAQANNFKTVVSARSGETEDSWLADLATGWRASQIKVGSTHGADRTAKWNRLLELEATENCEFAKPF